MADDGKWEQAVYLMTGWKVPARETVTDDLKGKGNRGDGGADDAVDIPWFSVTISNVGKTDASAAAQRLAALGGNYVLFFAGTGDSGAVTNAKALNLYVAKITYAWQTGSGVSGTNFHKFSNGVASLLDQLGASPWKTTGYSFDGLAVAEADSVDLGTFSYRAKSLDRAKLFFEEHETRLDGWVQAMGRDNAAWQGNAAGVFVNLLDTLRKQYKHYHEQLAPHGFSTQNASVVDGYVSKTFQGDGLIQAEQALSAAVKTLKDAWIKWHGDQNGPTTGTAPDGSANAPGGHWNAEDVMRELLTEIKQWLDTNNAGKVVTHSNYYGTSYGGTEYWYDLTDGFKENVPAYGSLTDPASWVKIGQEAVKRWNNNVTAHLDPAAETATTTLSSVWSKLMNTDWDPAYGFEEAPSATLTTTGGTGDDGEGDSDFDVSDIADILNGQNSSVNDALNDIASSTDDALNDMGSSTDDALNSLLGDGGSGGTDTGGTDTGGIDTGAVTSDLNSDLNNLLGSDGTTDGGTGTGTDGALGASPAYTSLLNSALNGIGSSGTGTTKVNPDGSITVTNPDGSTTTTSPDGTQVTEYPDGSTLTVDPDGTSTLVNADGSTSVQNADGSVTTTYPDGTEVTADPTAPTPVATSSLTTGLNGSLDNALNGLGSTTGSSTTALDGDFLYDDVPYTSSLSGALGGVSAGDGLTGSTGLNPGALAAASRMGGLNSEMTAAAERVRSGYSDSDTAVNGTARTSAARSATTTEQAAARATTSSGMPFMPPGAGQGGQQTQSEERTRTTWLSEDEEIWGTDEAAAPAVLGRDD
ncbi:AAWKG family protein [Streptomyces sp. NPDC003247]|uniref:AAWKG family protein n=1 Tax=Streptomyces sp. NPDC003247 TaxID=3364677 RepID=UPI003696CFA3